MSLIHRTSIQQLLIPVSTFVAVLLAIRFSYSPVLAAMSLPSETLASINYVFETYEVLLSFVLLAAVVLIVLSWRENSIRALSLTVLVLHSITLTLWFYYQDPLSSQLVRSFFPPLSIATVASSSALSFNFSQVWRRLRGGWQIWAYLLLLILVPLVFAMRTAASLGMGMAVGGEGVLQGNWFLVNLPTVLLELLAIGVWLNLLLYSSVPRLQRRWYAFLPFAALPLSMIGFQLRPLSGYILSALITWGSNLALFVPAWLSLGLAVTSVSCYFSSFILLEREGNENAWNLLFLGSFSVVLAGFYSSMASVEGLSFAMLVLGIVLSAWKREALLPGHPSSA